VLTSVVSGNGNVSGLTHNFGQVITVSGSGNWSCRTQQSQLMKHVDNKVPGDMCEYTPHSHNHRDDTRVSAKGGVCTDAALSGAMPSLVFPQAVVDKFSFFGRDTVNGKQCNHWTALGVSPGVDVDLWADDKSLPCEISERRSLSKGKWDITTWAFNGFTTTIPQEKLAECENLKCGTKPLQCAPKAAATDAQLGGALGWVCGSTDVDCTAINTGGAHFLPNTVRDHATWAFEAYWLKHGDSGGSCDFGGAAELTRGTVVSTSVPRRVTTAGLAFELDLVCASTTAATHALEVLV